jgi:hypothetical protein
LLQLPLSPLSTPILQQHAAAASYPLHPHSPRPATTRRKEEGAARDDRAKRRRREEREREERIFKKMKNNALLTLPF